VPETTEDARPAQVTEPDDFDLAIFGTSTHEETVLRIEGRVAEQPSGGVGSRRLVGSNLAGVELQDG
jgi:hypothetical protein